MPKRVAPLTDAQLKNLKPSATAKQLTDGQGLYLKLYFDRPSGHSWRFDYRSPVTGQRNTLVFGCYPAVSLSLARVKAADARSLIAQGLDPAGQRNEEKQAQAAAALVVAVADQRAVAGLAKAGTLLGVAEDMHASRLASGAWKALHATQWLSMIKRCVPAALAAMPIGDVKPAHILEQVIIPLNAVKKDATAITVRRFLSDLFDYAERMEIRQGNPARAIRKEVKKAEDSENIGNNPGVVTAEALTTVLRAVSDWSNPVTRAALQVQAALFQRPGDTCSMKWADVDLDAGLWTIKPQRRTKIFNSLKGAPHMIPLPSQVVAVLKALKPLTGHSAWVFLSTAGTKKPITNDTLTNALRNMGFGNVQNAHGFRATARTMIPATLGAIGQPQYVEAQLAHTIGMQTITGEMVRDPNGKAYNRAAFVAERVTMLQGWADYLDSLLTCDGSVITMDQPEPLALPLAA